MDTDGKNNENEEDASTKHILEYYKKYSQNRELPKYFSGSPVSYLPEIADVSDLPKMVNLADDKKADIIITTNLDLILVTHTDNSDKGDGQSKDTSRASSAMSNRKLEWDNGADIGYNNCQKAKKLFKSSSLPVLTDLKEKKVNFNLHHFSSDIKHINKNSEDPSCSINSKNESSEDQSVQFFLINSSSSEAPENINIPASTSSSSKGKKTATSSSSKGTTTSSSNTNIISTNHASKSGTSSDSSLERISKFAATLTYLKQKIGLPEAHSTPKFLEATNSEPEVVYETPFVKKTDKQPRKLLDNASSNRNKITISKSDGVLSKSKQKSPIKMSQSTCISAKVLSGDINEDAEHDKKQPDMNLVGKIEIRRRYNGKKIVDLCVTKPVTVECISTPPRPENKIIKTLVQVCSVAVQTENVNDEKRKEAVSQIDVDANQSVICLQHLENDKVNACCSTQTSSDMAASKCNSFEYLNGYPLSDAGTRKASNSPTPKESDVNIVNAVDNKDEVEVVLNKVPPFREPSSNLKRSQKTSNLSVIHSENFSQELSQSSSSSFCLGNFISGTQSNVLTEDIEKNIQLLHKLMRSKKYDPVTKKRYVRKIIKKITESKYLEESSTSSDLFRPKKSKSNIPKAVNVDSSDSTDTKAEHNILQSNLPWYPAHSQVKTPPRKRKLEIKTFVEEILPEQSFYSKEEVSSGPEIIPIDSRDAREKSCFTLTNNEFSVNHTSESSALKSANQEEVVSDNTSLEKQYESSSTSKSVTYGNWKEDKTLSEKILEARSSVISNTQTDYLVNIAKKEREYQITWINNEISHLSKLKNLLKRAEGNLLKRQGKSADLVPPDTSSGVRKHVNVYTVTRSDTELSQDGNKVETNYVIETELGTERNGNINFCLGGRRYKVENQQNGKHKANTHKVLGNIEVTSHDNITNIKVKTFCDACKKSPCVCVPLNNDKCPCKYLKGKCSCATSVKGSSGERSAVTSSSNSNEIYYKTPTGSGTDGNVHSKSSMCHCHRIPCICNKGKGKIPKEKPSIESHILRSDLGKVCPQCKKHICLCEEVTTPLHKGSDGSLSRRGSENDNSLKRVFENCNCNSRDECKCSFVEKLINHFRKNTAPTVCNCQEIGVQVSVQNGKLLVESKETEETQTQTIQVKTGTCKADSTDDVNTQTSEENFMSVQTESVQANTDTKRLHLQTSRENLITAQTQTVQVETDSKRDINTQTSRENLFSSQTQAVQVSMDRKFMNIPNSSEQTQTIQAKSDPNKDIKTSTRRENTEMPGVQVRTDTKQMKSQTSGDKFTKQTQVIQVKSHAKHSMNAQTSGGNLFPAQTHAVHVKMDTNHANIQTLSENLFAAQTQTVDSNGQDSAGKNMNNERCSKDKKKGVTFIDVQNIEEPIINKSSFDNDLKQDCISAETQTDKVQFIEKEIPSVGYPESDQASYQSKSCCNCGQTNSKTYNKGYDGVRTEFSYSGVSRGRNGNALNKRNTKKGNEEIDDIHSWNDEKSTYSSSSTPTTRTQSSNNGTHNSSSVLDSIPSESDVFVTCVCCKQKTLAQESSYLLTGSHTYHLCYCCVKRRPILTSVSYSTSDHVCDCYTTESSQLGQPQEYCTCTKPSRVQNSSYCGHCLYKLRKTVRSRKGIAYTLTLENETPAKLKSKQKKRKPALEEIKIKVPNTHNRKRIKDKENYYRKDGDNGSKESVEINKNGMVNGTAEIPKERQPREEKRNTLQEYLMQNRPDFIDSAEFRRNSLLNSRQEREGSRDEMKIKFYENNLKKPESEKRHKLFSEKEMKEITKKNYKKLPEVQGKLYHDRVKRLRDADKFIANVLTKRIQNNVLKGKRNFPIDTNVVSLPK